GAIEGSGVSVGEGNLQRAGLGDAESDGEGGILTDRRGGVERRDVASRVVHDDAVDEAIVAVHWLAVLPLDALVGMDEKRASPCHGTPRRRAGYADLDLADCAHIAHPAMTTRTDRLTM